MEERIIRNLNSFRSVVTRHRWARDLRLLFFFATNTVSFMKERDIMDENLKMHITIRTADDKEQLRIANSIHHQLAGNKDYKDSNIVLYINTGNIVELHVFKDCENIPDIVI